MPRSFHLGILREERVVERVTAAWVLVAWVLVAWVLVAWVLVAWVLVAWVLVAWVLVAWVLVAWVLVAWVLVVWAMAGASSTPHNLSRHRQGTACHGDCMAVHRTHW